MQLTKQETLFVISFKGRVGTGGGAGSKYKGEKKRRKYQFTELYETEGVSSELTTCG